MLRRNVFIPLAILAAGAAVTWWIASSRSAVEVGPSRDVAPLVGVIEAQPQEVRFVVHTQGTVVPRRESDLVPQVSGEVVWVSPNLVSGGFFGEKEVLVRIDAGDYRVDLEAARAVVARRESEAARDNTELDRQRSLAVEGVASQAQIDDAENAYRVSEAELREARARLLRAERDLSRTALRAPYSGRVRDEKVDVGQFVSRGAAIATLYATDYAEVRLPLPDRELRYLDISFNFGSGRPSGEEGNSEEIERPEVRLHAEFAGEVRSWLGHIVRTEGEIDPKSRMLNLVARVEDPYGRIDASNRVPLAVGLFVEAEIQGRRVENVYVLPRVALRVDGKQDRVHVVDAEGRLRFRDVTVLRSEREQVVIGSGLAPGDRVSVSPMAAAVNGMRVQVLEEVREDVKGAPAPEGEATPVADRSDP
jgi:RND family efflux transporter MFP subunit